MKITTAALMICGLLAPGMFQECAAQKSPKAFRVHYVGGPADFTGEHVDLTVTPDALFVEGKAGKTRKSVAVPLDGITVVVHSPMRFNRIQQVGPYMPMLSVSPPSAGSSGGSSHTMAGAVADPIAAGAAVAVFAAWGTYQVTRLMTLGIVGTRHGQKHYVTILWQKEGVEREWVVEASKDDYRPLMQQLEQFSGKKYVDLEARYQRFKEGIKREKDKAVSVSLDRQVKLDTEILPPGPYRLVLLEGESGHGELYFFAGKEISDAALRGVAVVEIDLGTGSQIEVVYSTEAPYRINEIRTPGRTFRLAAGA